MNWEQTGISCILRNLGVANHYIRPLGVGSLDHPERRLKPWGFCVFDRCGRAE